MSVLFTGKKIADFPVKQYEKPGEWGGNDIQEVTDPLGSGQTVFQMRVSDGDDYLKDGTPRAELVTSESWAEGTDYWYVMQFYVPTSTSEPAGCPTISQWLNFGEMFAHPWTFSSPRPIMAWAVSGVEKFVCRRPKGKSDEGSEDRPYQINLPRGKWVRLIAHEKFSKSEAEGYTEWFLKIGSEPEYQVTFFKAGESYNPNGYAETTKLTGRTLHPDTDKNSAWHYPKHYRKPGQFGTGTVYEKATCVATTRADIDAFIQETEGGKPDIDYCKLITDFGLLHREEPSRIEEVTDPLKVFPGKVLKFLTLENDQLVYSGQPRTEAQGHTGKFGKGDTIWWATEFIIPTALPTVPSGGWLSLTSLYGGPAEHESPIRVEIKNNKLMWQRSEIYGYDVPWEYGIPPKEKWVFVKFHEYLAESGWVEMWVKVGHPASWEQVTFFAGTGKATKKLSMNTIDQIVTGTHMKIMQYRLKGMTGWEDAKKPTVYFGSLRVASTELLVENPSLYEATEEKKEEGGGGGGAGEITETEVTAVTLAKRKSMALTRPTGAYAIVGTWLSGAKTISIAGATELGQKTSWGGGAVSLWLVPKGEGSISITWDGTEVEAECFGVGYNGVDGSHPVDAKGTWKELGKGKTLEASAITTETANALVVAFGVESNGFTATPPTGMTERVDHGTPASVFGMHYADAKQAGIASSGAKQFTLTSEATLNIGLAVALRAEGEKAPVKEKAFLPLQKASAKASTSLNLGVAGKTTKPPEPEPEPEAPGPPEAPVEFRAAVQAGSVHFATPLTLAGSAFGVCDQGSVDELAGCVYALIATERGERLEEPDYGIDDPTFGPSPVDLSEWSEQLRIWEPRPEIQTGQEIVDRINQITVAVRRA